MAEFDAALHWLLASPVGRQIAILLLESSLYHQCPQPLFYWQLKSAKWNHEPCETLTLTTQSSHSSTSTSPSGLPNFLVGADNSKLDRSLLWKTTYALWVWRRQNVFPGSSKQVNLHRTKNSAVTLPAHMGESACEQFWILNRPFLGRSFVDS